MLVPQGWNSMEQCDVRHSHSQRKGMVNAYRGDPKTNKQWVTGAILVIGLSILGLLDNGSTSLETLESYGIQSVH